MANYFAKINMSIRDMPKLPVAFSLTALLIISLAMGWEDYSTNFAAYVIFPTLKVNNWIVPFAAALPQVGQVAFMYAYATNTDSRWKLLVVLMFHLMDVTTDVYYKAHLSNQIGVWLLAFMESEILFTLGSEIALTLCIGLLPAVLPEAIAELSETMRGIHSALSGPSSQAQHQPPPVPPSAPTPQMPSMNGPQRDPRRPSRG